MICTKSIAYPRIDARNVVNDPLKINRVFIVNGILELSYFIIWISEKS